jgi:UTP--glucose-1-phosphate uridylyltransferase
VAALAGRLRIVIPAAGMGSRFLPLTQVVPKELFPLGEWPLIHHALLEVERAGIRDVVIVISPRKRAIRAYFEGDDELERSFEALGDVRALERLRAARALSSRLRVSYVEKETKGPGEAVLVAHRLNEDDVFGVLLPDDVVPTSDHWTDLVELNGATGASTLCVRAFPAAESGRFGVAVCERQGSAFRVRGLVEKPAWGTVDSAYRVFGRYVVTAPVVEALQVRLRRTQGELQLTDGYSACIGRAPGVYAVEFTDDFFDCGTPAAYARSVTAYAARPSAQPAGASQFASLPTTRTQRV